MSSQTLGRRTFFHCLWPSGHIHVPRQVQFVPEHDRVETPPPAGQAQYAQQLLALSNLHQNMTALSTAWGQAQHMQHVQQRSAAAWEGQ